MKNLTKNISGIIFISLFLFIGLKGCVISVINFDDYSVYERVDDIGQISRAFIIPGKDEIIYSKNKDRTFELGLFKIRGENATHYFGPVYNVGTFPFGLRIYSGANQVWIAQMELIDKMGNVSQTTFDDIGEKYGVKIIFYDDELDLGDENLQKIDFDESDIKKMRELFDVVE